MLYVIACHKLWEFMGTIQGGPLSLCSLLRIPCGEVSLQGSDHFFASLVLKLVYFKVAEIIIYCAKVVSVFKLEDIASNCFPWTVWTV